jgi:hypothetical protein
MGQLSESRKNFTRYKVNRPLTAEERAVHLPQKEPSPIPVAWPQMSVVRMNSTFLECVDPLFLRRGLGTGFCLVLFGIMAAALSFLIPSMVKQYFELTGSDLLAMLAAGGFMISFALFFIYISIVFLKFESFTYTYYPMRFNRKTRMVHVFLKQYDGRILSVPWDEVYFTGSVELKRRASEFYVLGHKLAEDGETILDTFRLPYLGLWEDDPYRFMQWEFVRQYMEGDDSKVAELANMVAEVSGSAYRRETPFESFKQAWSAWGGRNFGQALIASPFIILSTLGRIIAMPTCKIPRFPAEIEATCQYAPDDPNLRDDKHLAPRGTAKRPDVSKYAGR